MKTLIAHRGMSSLAPENTLAAFALTKEHGIHWIECDVDILHDGTLVLSHDDTLDRCTDKTGAVFDLSKADLAHIDAGGWFADEYQGEPIPTVTQLIELANRISLHLNIEIKSCPTGAKMAHQLVENLAIATDELSEDCQLIVSSFNHMILREFKNIRAHRKVACLFEAHNIHDDWQSILEWCEADYIHPQDKGLSREMVQKFKAAGVGVNVWTVNNLARANELFNWGVDGICTDVAQKFPSKYKQLL
ncbi:MAG: glycerophosphodiester phosphodiesterase family protein [Alphaproteobacteria bacterium]